MAQQKKKKKDYSAEHNCTKCSVILFKKYYKTKLLFLQRQKIIQQRYIVYSAGGNPSRKHISLKRSDISQKNAEA